MRNSWFKKRLLICLPSLRHHWFLLTTLAFFALVFLIEEFDHVTTSPTLDSVTKHRKLKERALVDYFDLRALSAGVKSSRRNQGLPLCGRERDHYVPCYNLTAHRLAGLEEGDAFDRHCELSRNEERCLSRPPKDYKIPLKWPAGRDVIWSGNVMVTQDQSLSPGSIMKRMLVLEENQISFDSDDGLISDGVKDYARKIVDMIGQGSESGFLQAGVQTVLDIGCGFGSFGAHLVSMKVMPVCIAAHEAADSQVQVALERGLPAHIGDFSLRQLPYPSLSFDMVHCAHCGVDWDPKDGKLMIEVDRVLKPGGYFVLSSPTAKSREVFAHKLCWTLHEQKDETFIWQKTKEADCSRKQGQIPICKDDDEVESYYQPLVSCISGTNSQRWKPIDNKSGGPQLSPQDLDVHGIRETEFDEDREYWRSALKNYWSLLSPLIFSDHPKRPGDEDPLPPYNMLRNVMDMNANYGGFNAALVDAKKSAWVMNVIPLRARNTLPLILDQGFAGVLHHWCQPFPTYPRTYDMLHGSGLLSHTSSEKCSMMDLFLEMDRILRPEGWVVLVDSVTTIEMARMHAAQMRWEARMIDLQNGSDQRLLVCQKPFFRK